MTVSASPRTGTWRSWTTPRADPSPWTGDLAREWLRAPINPNGRPNADVLRPWSNGMDVTRRPAGKWIIDFGWTMSEADVALYELPLTHVSEHVRPMRETNKRAVYRRFWW